MTSMESNPLIAEWRTPYGLPPFSEIKHTDYKPAITHAFSVHLAELKEIAENPEQPTFENTIAAYDRSGALLNKVCGVFYNLCSSECPPELQEIQMELSGPLAEHEAAVATFPGLYSRVSAVYEARHSLITEATAPTPANSTVTVPLMAERIRLVERIHLDLVRAGAKFDAATQARYKEIMMKLAELTTKFSQNVLADEAGYRKHFTREELSGVPADLIESMSQIATESANSNAGSTGTGSGEAKTPYCMTLSRSMVEPFLTYADNRSARETIWKAWSSRGQLSPERNNALLINEILTLRSEQARLHGYATFADYSTADTMAQTSNAVEGLLAKVWEPAKAACLREQRAIEDYIAEHCTGGSGSSGSSAELKGGLQPWDWRYYAEKIRQLRYNFDASAVKPYFPLSSLTEALFDCANRLFGLRFVHKPEVTTYHPDVNTYEVRETDAAGNDVLRAIFLHDNYSRSNKQSGAWMSEYRTQTRNFNASSVSQPLNVVHDGSIIPIVVNNNNLNKAPAGQETLLAFDDAVTIFHEFGHACHGMLSNVTYSRLASTNVLKDFVELPSQLFEHWLSEPEVLQRYARHVETKEVIPQDLLDRMKAADGFNKGFDTVEFMSSCLIDQYLHKITDLSADPSAVANGGVFDVVAFEKAKLAELGMPGPVIMRHRPTHFLHLFASSGYASAYYVYLWAEILDADGFDAFVQPPGTGPFDPAVAAKLRKFIYSTGNTMEPGEAYRLFRGRDPVVEPMLKKKHLV